MDRQPTRVPDLSTTEVEILLALCRPDTHVGPFRPPASNDQIALRVGLSPASVRSTLSRLSSKLGVPPGPGRRVRLANLAVQIGLIDGRGPTPS